MAPPGFERAVSYGVYDGSMRGVLHALKFEGMTPLVRRLGGLLAEAIGQFAGDAPAEAPEAMLVAPVPLHRKRMKDRGFNQAESLAAEALRVLRQTHPHWRLELSSRALVRERSTDSQAGLSPRQRRQNLRGAFFVPDFGKVEARHVLLVDDIYTTGATARACTKVLLKAGAASVRVATVARAQRRYPLLAEKRQRYMQVAEASQFGEEPEGIVH
jgi:ComF family protein